MSSPGGYSVKFTKVFSRSGSPLEGSGRQHVLKAVAEGTPEVKMAGINLCAAYAQIVRAQKTHQDDLKPLLASFMEAIEKARASDNPAVSAWAGYTLFALADEDRPAIARELATDPDWRHRQVAAAVLGVLPGDVQKEIATTLSTDPEPSVRKLAKAWLDFITLGGNLSPAGPTTSPDDVAAPQAR
jgi:hypothetical protein